MDTMMHNFLTAGMCVTTLALVGCGGGLKLQEVSGKASFAGKPIAYGSLEFIPDGTKGTKGPPGSAVIINGEYDTRKEGGRGVVPGPHLVRVTAYEEKPVGSTDETVPSTSKPPLLSGYTINVDGFTAEQNFDVPESAKGFDLFKPTVNRPKANDP